LGVKALDELIDKNYTPDIRLAGPLGLPAPVSEHEYLKEIKSIASKNKIFRTYIGLGYYNTIFLLYKRNILENQAGIPPTRHIRQRFRRAVGSPPEFPNNGDRNSLGWK